MWLLGGWYVFIETSWPRKVNDTARLVSQSLPATSQMCFQFWYHMYGDDIGNLTVYKKAGSTMITLWKKTGTQGPRWRHATIDLSSASTFKVCLFRDIFKTRQKSKMKPFAKIVNSFQLLAIFAKSFILDFWLDYDYASAIA